MTLKIAAKYADISHLVTREVSDLDHKLSVLEKHCDNVGRDFNDIRKGVFVRMGDSAPDVSMEEVIERIDEYKSRGVGLITFLIHGSGKQVLSNVELLAKEVLPRFK